MALSREAALWFPLLSPEYTRGAFFFRCTLFYEVWFWENSQVLCKLGFAEQEDVMFFFLYFAAFTVHLPSIWKELDHCWSCVSLSNTAPAASIQPDIPVWHFEAELFEKLHIAQMKGDAHSKDRVSVSCLSQHFWTASLLMPFFFLCLLSGDMFC